LYQREENPLLDTDSEGREDESVQLQAAAALFLGKGHLALTLQEAEWISETVEKRNLSQVECS
jgi:hypothetical protein